MASRESSSEDARQRRLKRQEDNDVLRLLGYTMLALLLHIGVQFKEAAEPYTPPADPIVTYSIDPNTGHCTQTSFYPEGDSLTKEAFRTSARVPCDDEVLLRVPQEQLERARARGVEPKL